MFLFLTLHYLQKLNAQHETFQLTSEIWLAELLLFPTTLESCAGLRAGERKTQAHKHALTEASKPNPRLPLNYDSQFINHYVQWISTIFIAIRLLAVQKSIW